MTTNMIGKELTQEEIEKRKEDKPNLEPFIEARNKNNEVFFNNIKDKKHVVEEINIKYNPITDQNNEEEVLLTKKAIQSNTGGSNPFPFTEEENNFYEK